jgi:arginine/ornithine N-succinyltransferase beta subunit
MQMSTDKTDSGWRKRQIALDQKAENARQLGLDYEPNKTVIEMARKAGFSCHHNPDLYDCMVASDKAIERFAALVRADERNRTWTQEHWTEYERSIAETEREGCHALRQTLSNPHEHCQVSAHAYDMAIAAYGAAIRARGQA